MGSAEGRKFERYDEVLRRVVLLSPDPPRRIPLDGLLRASYVSTSGKSIAGAGVICLLSGLYFALRATGDVLYLGVAIPIGTFGLLLIVAPALPARRAARAVRVGVRVLGEIIEISYRPPGDTTTIDAIENGFATGLRRVAHPRGTFDDKFESDASWAGRPRPGSRVLLLADPVQQRVLLGMGPAGESATLPESETHSQVF